MSDETNKKKLGYKPEFNYTEEYYSEGKEVEQKKVNIVKKSAIQQNIENNVNRNDIYLKIIPKEIASIIRETYDIAKEVWIVDLSDAEYGEIKYPKFEYEEKEEEDIDEEINEDSFWDTDEELEITEHKYNEELIIRQEYIKNMTDLLDYYFERLADIQSEYLMNFFVSVYDKKDEDRKFLNDKILDIGKVDVSKGNEHLLDISLKGEISAGLKLDFFSNMCSVEQTLMLFNNFKAITEMRKKYARSSYTDYENDSHQMRDTLLQASKYSYSHKYDKAFEELYRYLKGSLSLTSSVLSDDMQSIKAKKTLVETGGLK